jgi:hypothetical protein
MILSVLLDDGRELFFVEIRRGEAVLTPRRFEAKLFPGSDDVVFLLTEGWLKKSGYRVMRRKAP